MEFSYINVQGNPQIDLKDQGVIDSGCSRHMIGNMSYLTDYEEIDGGYVTFGGNPKGGKITRKYNIGKFDGRLMRFLVDTLSIVKPLEYSITEKDCGRNLHIGTQLMVLRYNASDIAGQARRNRTYYSIFDFTRNDEDDGVVADMNNLDTTIQVSPIPTTRIHKDHPLDQVMDFPDRVYKVEKALYGLHQAPRAWYETLSTYLLDNEFQRGKIDKTLFIKRYKGDILLVQVYVDDIIFGSTKKEDQKRMAYYLVKINMLVNSKEIWTDIKTASTPIETQKPLLKDEDGEEVDVHLHRSMIGSLMYLTSSRLDIMFAVCACARYQVNPKVSHIHAVKRIFRYLKGQSKLGLWYPKDFPFDLVAYTDSDYTGASLDRKSTTGVLLVILNTAEFLLLVILNTAEFLLLVILNTAEFLLLVILNTAGKAKKSVRLYGIKTERVIWHNLLLLLEVNAARHNLLLLLEVNAARHNLLLLLKVNAARHKLTTQFLTTAKVKTINGEVQIQALVDGKNFIITELIVTRYLQLEDVEGADYNVADEAVYKELDDSLVRAATTASSLEAEQDSSNINKTRSKATLNKPNPHGTGSGVNTPRSGKDSMKLKELMEFYTKLQQRVLDVENTKTTQAQEITSLKLRVGRSARVVSSDEASWGDQENASKQGRKINDINKDAEITLVDETQGRYGDNLMFDTSDLAGEEVFVAEQGVPDSKKDDVVSIAGVATTVTKPKVKGIVFKEPVESTKTTISSQQPSQVKVQDKGKGKIVEPEKPMKKKELIRLDEEITSKLQVEFDEEVRLVKEKAEKEKEANIISRDNVQAMIDVDY
ncbi:putative ribonuclease H-like domain-containing protein [Tanacetum coccineum]